MNDIITCKKNLKDIIDEYNDKLNIDDYQRPYTWSEEAANTLFNDIYNAMENNKEQEYRLGSLILHHDKDANKFNIVDGQQRLITIALILKALGDDNNFLLYSNIKAISRDNIIKNYNLLKSKVKDLCDEEKKQYKDYIKKCTFAVIITENMEEAFQLFDSQNTRGKSLKPHDLLKAYHLREMKDADEYSKVSVVKKWDNMKEDKLASLFADYLYPIICWCKKRDGIYYSEKDIDVFKGISVDNQYNYALYHKRSVVMAEKITKEFSCFLHDNAHNMFQLTQPFFAGEYFFKYVFHYYQLLSEVDKIINQHHTNSEEIPNYKIGDKYVRNLYICALLLFADRFGIHNLEKLYIDKIYYWSYSLRLVIYALQIVSINKYAIGNHDRIGNIALFEKIAEMKKPEEIMDIVLVDIESCDKFKPNESYIYKSHKAIYKKY